MNKFYIRKSTSTFELSLEELREQFLESTTLEEKTRSIRDNRLVHIVDGNTPITLKREAGLLTVHIIPLSALTNRPLIDLELAITKPENFAPPRNSGYSPRFNFDGILISSHIGQDCNAYTQIFRTGLIETVCTGIVKKSDGYPIVPSGMIEKMIIDSVSRFLKGMNELAITPPVFVLISLQDVLNAQLGTQNFYTTFDDGYTIDRNSLNLPEITISDLEQLNHIPTHVRPALDALWNAAGFSKSQNYDASGNWVRPH